LLPLQQEESVASNPYPIDALPLLAKEAVLAISEYVQSPIAMTAQCVIGAMSHIAQAKVNAPDRFKAHGEPCSLFLLTEGQSGSRKSTSKNLADRAILDYERKQYEIYRTELEQWKSGLAGLPKKTVKRTVQRIHHRMTQAPYTATLPLNLLQDCLLMESCKMLQSQVMKQGNFSVGIP
jgi:hypothetical protein